MTKAWRVWLCALSLVSLSDAAHAQSVGTQSAAAVWVASRGTASLRLGRGVVEDQVDRASALLLPYEQDPRFTVKKSSIRHLPHKNLIEIKSEGVVEVPWVEDKIVSVTVRIKPEIVAQSLRLTYAGMRRSVSRCEVDGPICFMVKRAIDQHVGNGAKIQEFLDSGLNAALKPVFRAAADLSCGEGHVVPSRVTTAPEFLEVLMAERSQDLACLRQAHVALPNDLRSELKRASKTPGHRSSL
ncbi:MAG: hypothetical protein QM778_21260 [Myxococcales bacterium]